MDEAPFRGTLYFNGINGATGTYGFPPTAVEMLAARLRGTPPTADEMRDELKFKRHMPAGFPVKPGVDPADLAQAGWALIFPAAMPDARRHAIKEALSELLTLRREQAGDRFRIYEGDEGYHSGETKHRFFARHRIGPGAADPDQLPFYVLLIGSPAEIPYTFQHQLDVMRGVGRLDFGDDLEAYARYARSVAMAEHGQVRLPRRVALFGTANPDDRATALSARYLIRPLYRNLLQPAPENETALRFDWQLHLRTAEQATRAQLARLLGGDETPALLITASHGMEFPLGDPRQLPHQGALLCQDWPGPKQWRGPLRREFYFAGEDLADATLTGLIALFFACYSGGTPRLDQFARQMGLTERRTIAPHPFTGALPRRMLRQGALAVLGHVERAWGYSFLLPQGGVDVQSFVTFSRSLLNGEPVGLATDPSFNLRYADMASELSEALEELAYGGDIPDALLVQLWTASNDARAYIVLGDPAARLPFTRDETSEPPRRPAVTLTETEIARLTAPPTPAAESAEPPAPEIEAYALNGLTTSIHNFTLQLADALSRAARDLVTLEVRTYTADDLDAALADDASAAKAELRLATRIHFDGDVDLYLPAEAGDVDEKLRQLHLDMVREAQANRAQFLSAITKMAVDLWKNLPS